MGLSENSSSMERRLTPYVPRLVLEWNEHNPSAECREIEGTLVFVDISGFTAMSERLAGRGKAGAEEVTDVLNGTFTKLLEVAYALGGSLLKFGGDALLLLFTDEGSPTRACRAAALMRNTLRKIGAIDTSAGKIRLDMSIGIHSGTFHFFLVGDGNRELIVASPESSKTVEMESLAGPGEILLSESTASSIDEEHLGPLRDGGRLLLSPCDAVEQGITPVADSFDAGRLLPPAIRQHILGGGDEAEHRQVTVGFIHFSGIDALIAETRVNEATERVRQLVTLVQGIAEENEICVLGTDIANDGGKIILTAGAPSATGNDEERMLRALRDLCDRSRGLELRIGVHRGHVFAGDVGPPYRRTYTVMGDAVNTAARVMARAEHNQILATREVIDRSATLFKLKEIAPFKAKGKTEDLVAFALGRPLGRREPPLAAELPLIGRLGELEQLRSALESAAKGLGRVVEVCGDGGLGKSRLIQELTNHADNIPSLIAQCEQYEISTPFFPFNKLLRWAVGSEGDEAPDKVSAKLRAAVDSSAPGLVPWLPLVGSTMNLDLPATPETEALEERFQSARLNSAVISLLEVLLVEPTLIVFEDAHWMDAASRELLGALVRRMGSQPWAVYITTREPIPQLEGDSVSILALRPLARDESIALARLASRDSLLPQHAEVVARRGGGNPMFVQALVAAARDTSDLGELPETIESAIAARIDKLNPSDRRVLREMAVLGREIDLALLSGTLEQIRGLTLEPVLNRLTDFLVVSNGKATFRQALIRDAAYEGLSFKRRRTLHERVGRLIEEGAADPNQEAELLALHFDKAECFEESWRYARIAVGRAWRKHTPSNVIDFSRKALVAGKHLRKPEADMCSMWMELGSGSFRLGQYEEAAKALENARRLTRDLGVLAWFFFMQGRCRENLGERTQALRWYGRGLKLLETEAPFGRVGEEPMASVPPDYRAFPPRVRLIESQASVRREQGQLRKSVELSHQAVTVADTLGDREGLAIAYNLLQLAYTDMRDPARRRYGELALSVADEVGNRLLQATVLNNLAVDSYWQGDWRRSLSLYEASRERFSAAGDVIWAAAVSNNIGEILSDQGKLEEAETLFVDALSTFRAARFELHAATITANLGRLAGRAGRFDEGEGLLQEAIDALKEMGYPSVEAESRMVEIMVLRGEGARALDALQQIEPGDDPILQSMLHRLSGWSLGQSGRAKEAGASFEVSLDLARGAAAAFEIGLTLDALRTTAHSEVLRDKYSGEATEIFERLGVVSLPQVPLSR